MYSNRVVLFFLSLFLSGSLYASGISGGGFSNPRQAPKLIDQNYETGKAIYLGREPGTEKIRYCVMVDGEAKKIKRSRLKEYKGGPVNIFANALVNCDAPDELALTRLTQEQIPFVLYYLNKRYKLKLGSG